MLLSAVDQPVLGINLSVLKLIKWLGSSFFYFFYFFNKFSFTKIDADRLYTKLTVRDVFLSPVPIAEKRLMDVKLSQLPSWFGTRDFTPNGLIGSVRRGENVCGKCVNRVRTCLGSKCVVLTIICLYFFQS